ncbi:MAG: FAD/NAD(P)-binding protein, partial [Deltaproteobacteria bacterium]|nr:FAD/NAD(P)-binding protein [Deltaproteobacteria bacterium]
MESAYLPRPARIERITRLTEKERLFRILLDDGKPLGHEPGQFIMLSILGVGEAPISVSSSSNKKNEFEICVRAVGSLTNVLHSLPKGSRIGIRGPYGKRFPVEEMAAKDLLFIAGGIGIVPLRGLIKTVLMKRHLYGKIILLYGVKSPEEILFKDELIEWANQPDFDLRITVDKPHPDWKGHTGVVTTFLPELKIEEDKTVAVIVGPHVMYKYII